MDIPTSAPAANPTINITPEKAALNQTTIRELYASNEIAFQMLLKSVYGDTYSYRELYKQGKFAKLIESGKLKSFGEFNQANELIGHTGFWHKDPHGDYVESGLSFRLPSSKHFEIYSVHQFWQYILNEFAQKHAFIFQHTSTYHSFAQHYAVYFMNAIPCGIILEYAENEKIKGINHSLKPMHALSMVSVLRYDSLKNSHYYLPEICAEWLLVLYDNLKLPRSFTLTPISEQETFDDTLLLDTIENNNAISLERRVVCSLSPKTDITRSLYQRSQRNDLIHLPLHDELMVSQATSILLNAGYLPIGLRPHISRPDELIFQYCIDKKLTIGTLFDDAKFYGESTNKVIKKWQNIALQIL